MYAVIIAIIPFRNQDFTQKKHVEKAFSEPVEKYDYDVI